MKEYKRRSNVAADNKERAKQMKKKLSSINSKMIKEELKFGRLNPNMIWITRTNTNMSRSDAEIILRTRTPAHTLTDTRAQ